MARLRFLRFLRYFLSFVILLDKLSVVNPFASSVFVIEMSLNFIEPGFLPELSTSETKLNKFDGS